MSDKSIEEKNKAAQRVFTSFRRKEDYPVFLDFTDEFEDVVPLTTISNGRYLLAVGDPNEYKETLAVIKRPTFEECELEEHNVIWYESFYGVSHIFPQQYFIFRDGEYCVALIRSNEGEQYLQKLLFSDNKYKKHGKVVSTDIFGKKCANPVTASCQQGDHLALFLACLAMDDEGYVIDLLGFVVLLVYDCSESIEKPIFKQRFEIPAIHPKGCCFIDGVSKVGFITAALEFYVVEISNVNVEKEAFRYLLDDDEDNYFNKITIHKISFESWNQDRIFALSSRGSILDINNKKYFTPNAFKGLTVYQNYLCQFNKYIYAYCEGYGNQIIVYDALQDVKVYAHCLYHDLMHLTIDWFGDNLIYRRRTRIGIQRLFKSMVMSLKYLSRMAVFKAYSYQELKEMSFGKNIKKVIFDNL